MGQGPALLAELGKATSPSECVLMYLQREKAGSGCGLGSCETIHAPGVSRAAVLGGCFPEHLSLSLAWNQDSLHNHTGFCHCMEMVGPFQSRSPCPDIPGMTSGVAGGDEGRSGSRTGQKGGSRSEVQRLLSLWSLRTLLTSCYLFGSLRAPPPTRCPSR